MKKLLNRTTFFWMVNIVFMAVSVLHAGVFFGLGSSGVNQILGFAVSFFLDLVTIILMQALLESKYRGDEQKARKFLFFIIVCCATSTFANLAISLNNFKPEKMLPDAPMWVQVVSPYVLASFPLFVILMSIAAEMIINVRPLDSLNAQEFEESEKKRLAIIKIRNDYLQMMAQEELRAATIRVQRKKNKKLAKTAKLEDVSPDETSSEADGEASAVQGIVQEETFTEVQEQEQSETVQPAANIIDLNARISARENDERDEQRSESEPVIDGTSAVQAKPSQRMRTNGDAAKKVQRALKKNPNITAKVLAARTGISESYASKLKAQHGRGEA